jgi:hypothetical protein
MVPAPLARAVIVVLRLPEAPLRTGGEREA